jgi:hypothetical protein
LQPVELDRLQRRIDKLLFSNGFYSNFGHIFY